MTSDRPKIRRDSGADLAVPAFSSRITSESPTVVATVRRRPPMTEAASSVMNRTATMIATMMAIDVSESATKPVIARRTTPDSTATPS